jgi:hypothetical protein
MALTIPYLFFGTMASALNNSKHRNNKMVLQASGGDARQNNKTL